MSFEAEYSIIVGLDLAQPILENLSLKLVGVGIIEIHFAVPSSDGKCLTSSKIIRANEAVACDKLVPNTRLHLIMVYIKVLNITI